MIDSLYVIIKEHLYWKYNAMKYKQYPHPQVLQTTSKFDMPIIRDKYFNYHFYNNHELVEHAYKNKIVLTISGSTLVILKTSISVHT